MDNHSFNTLSNKLDLIIKKLDSISGAPHKPNLISIVDFRKQYKITRPTVYNWCTRGLIKMKKIGGRQFVEIDSIKFTKKYQRDA